MKAMSKTKLEFNAGDGVELFVKKSDEKVIINVELKETKNSRQIFYDNKQLDKILRRANQVCETTYSDVKINEEWLRIIKRLVNQSRI